MKWIKSRSRFVNEAKIGDVINPEQAKRVKEKWGSKFLDYDEVEPTDKIKQGKWKLTEEDKNKVLSAFFSSGRGTVNISEVQKIFSGLSDKFVEVMNLSLTTLASVNASSKGIERAKEVLQEFDIKNPSIDEMVAIFEPVFRKLSNETGKSEMIQKDDSGRPIMGEDNRPIKVAKEIGDPVFEKNLINILSFVQNFNTYYEEDKVDENIFEDSHLANIINLAKDDINSEYKTSFKIFGRDIYLKISHNPKDILNMSISKFYTSCQHLYTGMYSSKVLGNIFDPNSIPAFLVFDTPIYNGDQMISEQLPLSRMIIRNLESFDDIKPSKKSIFNKITPTSDDVVFTPNFPNKVDVLYISSMDKSNWRWNGTEYVKEKVELLFDRAYPDRMKEGNWGDVFGEIVEKYTGMKSIEDTYGATYLYTPDIEDELELEAPYMDQNKGLLVGKYIGVNTKKLYLSSTYDWSKVKVAPNAKIKELIIENPDLPQNLLDIDLNLEWVKFKFIDIADLSGFSNIKSDSIAFDKCKITNDSVREFCVGKQIKRLQLTSCDIDDLDLSGLNVDELQLLYTVDNSLQSALGDAKFNKLVVSGDLMANKENKEFLNGLKRSGVKIETTGLVI